MSTPTLTDSSPLYDPACIPSIVTDRFFRDEDACALVEFSGFSRGGTAVYTITGRCFSRVIVWRFVRGVGDSARAARFLVSKMMDEHVFLSENLEHLED